MVEYEGGKYGGFQYQVNSPSIQEELERAVAKLTGEAVRVSAAGRTDAGVHARGQVVAFDTRLSHAPVTFVEALNFHLPDDISVRSGYRVHEEFDPRRHALSRIYTYTILNSQTRSPLMRRTSHLVREPLDAGTMHEGAQLFVGRHDFGHFAGAPVDPTKSTVRDTFRSSVCRSGEVLTFEVKGSSFLRHQVRRMAGALLELGRNRISLDDLRLMIESKADGIVAHTLPPHGLCLMNVRYADFPPKVGVPDAERK